MLKKMSLFSGIGAPEKALAELGIQYELVAFCENDKYAARSYEEIHGVGPEKNLGDIKKVDEQALPKDIDLITYGFPCQDISNAGKMRGFFNEDGTQTRSGLFFEALRIIEAAQPKVAIAENVKMLTSKKFALQFKIVLDSLEAAGYNNYFQVMNAKHYGMPQNRERVIIVSIRRDIDNGDFRFPESEELKVALEDLLEKDVEKKYFVEHWPEGLMEQRENCLRVREATAIGYADAMPGDSINFEHPNSKTRRGRVGKRVAQTLTTSPQQVVVLDGLKVRRFTPKECFRLMGFSDEDYERARAVNTERQLYKQAGNSIVVHVMKKVIERLIRSGIL